jgi:hypothetical protein
LLVLLRAGLARELDAADDAAILLRPAELARNSEIPRKPG